jgi:hypothetical protein
LRPEELIEKRGGICQTEHKTDRQTGRMEKKGLGKGRRLSGLAEQTRTPRHAEVARAISSPRSGEDGSPAKKHQALRHGRTKRYSLFILFYNLML